MAQPNILYIMTDQQRFDTIAALGDEHIYTPNLDRLVRRGVTFTNAYSECPVCVPARYTIRSGCLPPATGCYGNGAWHVPDDAPAGVEGRCGPYLARTMRGLGYRTFGIGKFHTTPWNEDLGYEVHLHSEELYHAPNQRSQDAYARWIADNYPAYDRENLMGERTEMYYQPQRSVQSADATVDAWAAKMANGQLAVDDDRPYFGFVSFIGPHPPFAPPEPFSRMYDPDRMPAAVKGNIEIDHMDAQIPAMNRKIWADELNAFAERLAKARYYGEISYIDMCLGKILDAVDARGDADNTLICFFADHGDHLGDHHAWQKESYFEASCHVPFLLSWPPALPADARRDSLVGLADLFGIATSAAGEPELRDGADVLGAIGDGRTIRQHLVGYYGKPGTDQFKVMIRWQDWKYVYIANGGREQLFNVREDPSELVLRNTTDADVLEHLRETATEACMRPGAEDALERSALKAFAYTSRDWNERVIQMDESRGARGFPETPADAVAGWDFDI